MGLEVAMERMSKEKGGSGGRVVVVSSTCGVTCQGDMFATPAYTASKHAVTALTRTMGVSLLATSNLLPAAQVLGGADGGASGGGGSLLHRFPLPLPLTPVQTRLSWGSGPTGRRTPWPPRPSRRAPRGRRSSSE